MTGLDDSRTVTSPHPTATHEKALALNLDKSKYGTIAEIGAGQEVARWFFVVGGAAGTVAKTISAYDMAVSDAMYGHAPRYVSRERLHAMLEYEFRQLLDGLGETVTIAGYVVGKFLLRRRFLRSLRIAWISPEELERQLAAGDKPLIVDVRSPVDVRLTPYALQGAIQLAVEDLEQGRGELPRDRDVVVYCS